MDELQREARGIHTKIYMILCFSHSFYLTIYQKHIKVVAVQQHGHHPHSTPPTSPFYLYMTRQGYVTTAQKH